jgi:hypothetical protein
MIDWNDRDACIGYLDKDLVNYGVAGDCSIAWAGVRGGADSEVIEPSVIVAAPPD